MAWLLRFRGWRQACLRIAAFMWQEDSAAREGRIAFALGESTSFLPPEGGVSGRFTERLDEIRVARWDHELWGGDGSSPRRGDKLSPPHWFMEEGQREGELAFNFFPSGP
jgi:hypothetical protein